MNQNTIGMNTMMTNQNTMGMNPMMMNQNAMGMNTMGMNPMMNMMNCPFIDMQEFWIYQEKDNIIKQNEVLNNLINKYELKKNDILTIEQFIQNNMNHLQNCIEKKNDNNYLFSLSNISMGRIFSSLENKYIDLDLKELINSQNILEGYWDENFESKKLINIIGINSYESICKKIQELNIVGPTIKIIYTIFSIYYLKNINQDFLFEFNEYKLIIDKAKKFLTKYGINYNEFEEIINKKRN